MATRVPLRHEKKHGAQLHIISNHLWKFEVDPLRTVEGVAHTRKCQTVAMATRVPLGCQKKSLCTSSHHTKPSVKVWSQSDLPCRRSCAHKISLKKNKNKKNKKEK